MCTCQIKWIDANGQPTPDDNAAIGRVRCKARVQQFHGRAITFSETPWFYICKEHAEYLKLPGMEFWEFEPLSTEQ